MGSAARVGARARTRARAVPDVHPGFLQAGVAMCDLAATYTHAGVEAVVRCVEALPLPPIAEQLAIVRGLRAAFAAVGGAPDASVVGALAWLLLRGDPDAAEELLRAVVVERTAMAQAREAIGSVADELAALLVPDEPMA